METTTETKSKTKVVQAATLPPELQERVLEIAEERDWSAAKTAGYLIKLGLEKLSEDRRAKKNGATSG